MEDILRKPIDVSVSDDYVREGCTFDFPHHTARISALIPKSVAVPQVSESLADNGRPQLSQHSSFDRVFGYDSHEELYVVDVTFVGCSEFFCLRSVGDYLPELPKSFESICDSGVIVVAEAVVPSSLNIQGE